MIGDDSSERLLYFLISFVFKVVLEFLFILSVEDEVVELILSYDLGSVIERV